MQNSSSKSSTYCRFIEKDEMKTRGRAKYERKRLYIKKNLKRVIKAYYKILGHL